MSDLAKQLGAGTLTSEQVDAITRARLNLMGSIEYFDRMVGDRWGGDLEAVCRDSVQKLQDAFPFLLEGGSDGSRN